MCALAAIKMTPKIGRTFDAQFFSLSQNSVMDTALLSPSSAVVRAFLAKRTSSFASDNDDFDDEETTLIAREFDGVTVRCSIPKGDKFATKKALISLAFPKLSQQTTTQQSRRRQEREDVCKATLMETYGAMPAVTAVRVLTFLGGEEEDDDAPEFGCDVTVEVDLKRLAALNDDDDEKEENIEAISKVRMYAGYGTLRECLKRVSRTKREDDEDDDDDWVPALRRQFVAPAVSMYCRVEEDESLKDAEEGRSCTVVIPMHISSSVSNNEDEVVIARAFLAHFAEASRSSARLSAAPFVNYHKPGNKPPLELTTTTTKTKTNNNNNDDENGICDDDEVDEMDLNANGGYISFVLFPRHVKTKESLERAVWLLASFPNFIKSHLKCSKAYWHGKMRGKAEELLETLKRAQKEPKASPKKKLMSGRTYVPR